MLVRQRKIVGGEKNLQEDIFLNQTRENGEPATLDPVLDDEELADDEDDSGHVADGEDAHHAGQNQSQVRLVPSFLPGSDVRVPEKQDFSFSRFLCILSFIVHATIFKLSRVLNSKMG